MIFLKTKLGITLITMIFVLIGSITVPIYMYTSYVKTGTEAEMYKSASQIRTKYRIFLENDQVISYNRANDLEKTISIKSDSEEAKFTIGNISEDNDAQNNAGFVNFDLSEDKEIIINVTLKKYELKEGQIGSSQDICDVSNKDKKDISLEKCKAVTENFKATLRNEKRTMKVINVGESISVSNDKTEVAIKRAKIVMVSYGELSMIENPLIELEEELKKLSGIGDKTVEVIDFKGSANPKNLSGFQEFYNNAVKKYVTDSSSQSLLYDALDIIISDANKFSVSDDEGNVTLEVIAIKSDLVKSATTGFYYSQYIQAEKISYSGNTYEPNKWMGSPNGQDSKSNGYDVISFGLEYTILVKRVELDGSYISSEYLKKIEGLF